MKSRVLIVSMQENVALPETCPSFLIILAGLMMLVERSSVLFCIGLWGIILTNLRIRKMSYKSYPIAKTPHHDHL